jgi:tetratricopeptide (TPR) repeat protein
MPAVTDPRHLRTTVTGLVGFAAIQEQELLATRRTPEDGSADRWAAAPLVAHNTEFKQQQVQRLKAIMTGTAAPDFAEIDHGSAPVYAAYAAVPADAAAQDSWAVTGELIGGLAAIPDVDLVDPERNPWLKGRMLWLQVVVRGFWHPTGHLGEYYLARGQAEAAVRLARRGVATAADLEAPPPVSGMASYNLACFLARADEHDEAAATLTEAIAHNPDLRANAGRDPDLASLRAAGRLAAVLGG